MIDVDERIVFTRELISGSEIDLGVFFVNGDEFDDFKSCFDAKSSLFVSLSFLGDRPTTSLPFGEYWRLFKARLERTLNR